MNFYAGIVDSLNANFVELRGLNDKGRVAIFHIIDYILKFYVTGFSQRDLEHANFMTKREEFFPSRQLASLIIRLLDGRLWRRKDSRSPEYRLLHHTVHDLGVMFLRYGPEQMELRHTLSDFQEELQQLERTLGRVDSPNPEQRLEPIHAQIRLARVLELIGNHFDARLAYYKALRWLRHDIKYYESAETGERLVTTGFISAFASIAIETLLAVGRLQEEVGEYRGALQMYLEAERLFEETRDKVRRRPFAPPRPPAAGKTNGPTWLRAADLATTLGDESEAPETRLGAVFDVIAPPRPVTAIRLEDRPTGLVDVFNHQAIAYAKLWERVSANNSMFKALIALHEGGDEYGVVDQMFFIGQVMARRRDFRAAALWYAEALRKVAAIRSYGDDTSTQSGHAWQTSTMAGGTTAALLAALGDVCYATGGQALISEGAIRSLIRDEFARGGGPTRLRQRLSAALRGRAEQAIASLAAELSPDIYEDRPNEFFHTAARYHYQAIGDVQSANDVYLRQLETRLDRFRRAMGTTLRSAADRYAVLNAWVSFWKGARVMLHHQLTVPSALSRNRSAEWGRMADFRRMATLLRLVGEMMRELAILGSDSSVAKLFYDQSEANLRLLKEKGAQTKAVCDGFYRHFTTKSEEVPTHLTEQQIREELNRRANLFSQVPFGSMADEQKRNDTPYAKLERVLLRVGVNQAGRDIRTIFAYISDRAPLVEQEEQPPDVDLIRVGPRSPLCRLNGTRLNDATDRDPLPVAFLLSKVNDGQATDSAGVKDLRLLALSEKGLLAAYMAHRDAIPDFGYATTALAVGELYITTMRTLCTRGQKLGLHPLTVAQSIHHCGALAKRFIIRAIDVLKREREQNRNTFHLMSEAHFNLGDLLLIRLAALTHRKPESFSGNRFFPPVFLGLDRGDLVPSARANSGQVNDDAHDGDWSVEDLMRQIWDSFRQGLILVQNEMDDYKTRFRLPPDVYYAHRNVMDAVLHFRICRAAGLRHAAGGIALPRTNDPELAARAYGFNAEAFDRRWDKLSRDVASLESPQRPLARWLTALRPLLAHANEVRSDRALLELKGVEPSTDPRSRSTATIAAGSKLSWMRDKKIRKRERFVIFSEVAGDGKL